MTFPSDWPCSCITLPQYTSLVLNSTTTMIHHADSTTPTTLASLMSSTTLEAAAHPIDAALMQHIASDYWAWRALYDADGAARISQHPDYVLADVATSPFAAKQAFFVTCSTRTQLVGAAILTPHAIGSSTRFAPAWNLHGYRLGGNRFLGAQDVAVQSRLLESISTTLRDQRADFLLIEDIESDDPLLTLAGMGSHGTRVFTPTPFQTRHKIVLPESHEIYWQNTFASKTRNTLRRKIKQFGDSRLECITEAAQIPDFLRHANEISKNTWQSDLLGLRVANDNRELALFTTLATEQALRCYLLWQGDRAVSFCLGTQCRGLFSYEEVGYDQAYADYSPGQVLVLKMIEDLFAHDTPRVCDFGGGHAEYKRQFATHSSTSGNVWLMRPGIRTQAIIGYVCARRTVGQGIRAALNKTGVFGRIRQWTRGKK